MKQNITAEQLNELSDKGKEKVRNWCEKKDYGGYVLIKRVNKPPANEFTMAFLSIGQMIEFLDEHNWKENLVITKSGPHKIVKLPGQEKLPDETERAWYCADLQEGMVTRGYGNKELTDSLWEACKDVLDEN